MSVYRSLGVLALAFSAAMSLGQFQLKLNKVSVAGQNSVQGTILIAQPSSTALDYVITDDSPLVTTPAFVRIPASQTSKLFRITVVPVTTPQFTTITATRGAVFQSQPLILSPLAPSAMAFTPNPVAGGQSVSCRLVVNGVAGPTGQTISLSVNSPYAVAPASVIVPPGGTQVIFTITTVPVASRQTVVLMAQANGLAKAATFRILAP